MEDFVYKAGIYFPTLYIQYIVPQICFSTKL